MIVLQPNAQPVYYVITSQNIDGITRIGELTVVNNELTVVSGEGELAFLDAAKSVSYKPLPVTGTWIEAGQIYGYGGGCVIVRQSHARTEHAPADVPALFMVYRADQDGELGWIVGEKINIGTLRTYGGKTWRCIQAHTTQSDWTPPAVPALWVEYSVVTPGIWVVGVAYKVGDIATYNGTSYRCLQAHTSQATWTPPAVPALWQVA